jgi:hypothetical protein
LGAAPENPEYANGHMVTAKFSLEKVPNRNLWKNDTATIIYHSEGAKCAIISELDAPGERRYPLCPDNFDPVIHVSTADSKYEFENNKTNMFVIWLGIGFTIASVYYYVADIARDSSKPNTPTSKKNH